MKPDWKGFCEYVISVNGNISIKKTKAYGIPEGNAIELVMRAAQGSQSFVQNAKKTLVNLERR